MLIQKLFVNDVTRDIPPVIYFHEQSPEKVKAEVSEYIITGGWPRGHANHKRVPNGIHEQYVRLLRGMTEAAARQEGPELPASWISGFYGSGKSSFAKLLGLALDGVSLPDGTLLSDALIRRDTSPRAAELAEAWQGLSRGRETIACVFDVGGAARDNEQIHNTVVRRLQHRLGYSPDLQVASFELRLEEDGLYPQFLQAAQEVLGAPWESIKDTQLVDSTFSMLMHRLRPNEYDNPMAWLQIWMGQATTRERSPNEAVADIGRMLAHRAPGKTLFIVIDEVSQYIHQDHQRMLRLQSFVSALGQRLRGQAWLLVTGQEKLESQNESTVLGRLKDRFPDRLRVHLSPTNIRDVVHRRLLQKKPEHEATLRVLFHSNRQNLQLYAYDCQDINESDFIEVYPLLPQHIELLMQITSALRSRSKRRQGDDHAIRGLIQLLGELFREQKLADQPVGNLISLDRVFSVYESSFDYSVQGVLGRILKHCSKWDDPLAARAAKVVALLQLISEQTPTTAALVAQCLYDRLDRGDNQTRVHEALERLRTANLLGYSEKRGYKLRSSAGEEWDTERSRITVASERQSELVAEQLTRLVARADRPTHLGVPFPLQVRYSDNHGTSQRTLRSGRTGTPVMPVDLRWLTNLSAREPSGWISSSAEPAHSARLIWVVGEVAPVQEAARNLHRSRAMVERYKRLRESLTTEKKILLTEEEGRVDELEVALMSAVGAAWMSGALYFRGRAMQPGGQGGAFTTALAAATKRVLPELYPRFNNTRVTTSELKRLLGASLAGSDPKFMPGKLGLLKVDAGRVVAWCEGEVPAGVLRHIKKAPLTGKALFEHFLAPPHGYAEDLVRASLAAMLWGKWIRFTLNSGDVITSVGDQGARKLFEEARPLRNARIVYYTGPVSQRDRNRICRLFKEALDETVNRQDEDIADAVYEVFPRCQASLSQVRDRLARLSPPRTLPPALTSLQHALEACRKSRQVEPTVTAVKENLDALNDGLPVLSGYALELTDALIDTLNAAARLLRTEVAQLDEIGRLEDAEGAARVEAALSGSTPWREIPTVAGDVEALKASYRQARQALLDDIARQAEEARQDLRGIDGFDTLNAAAANRVLHTITAVVPETTEDKTYPTLAAVRDRFAADLRAAIERAQDILDDLLDGGTERPLVQIRVRIRQRIIENPAQLDALLDEVRQRVTDLLAQNKRIRILPN